MLTSAVTYKQRLLHQNEFAQLLHIYGVDKCYGLDKSCSRKLLQSSAKKVMSNFAKKTRSFLAAVQFVTSLNV